MLKWVFFRLRRGEHLREFTRKKEKNMERKYKRIRCGRLYDGVTEEWQENRQILVEDRRPWESRFRLRRARRRST